jgi:hypothetical protein
VELVSDLPARGHGSWLAVGNKLGNDPHVLPRRSVITTNVRCPTLDQLTPSAWQNWLVMRREPPIAGKKARWSAPAARRRRYTVIQSGQFIEETIRSVLLQGYSDLEHIIIDRGSTDGSVNNHTQVRALGSYWVSARPTPHAP